MFNYYLSTVHNKAKNHKTYLAITGQIIGTGTKNHTSNEVKVSNTWERKPLLLWVDQAMAESIPYSDSMAIPGFSDIFVDSGIELKFLSPDFLRHEPWATTLNRNGIESMDGDWFRENWQAWFKDNGATISYVVFCKPGPLEMFLPVVHRHTKAAVLYLCPDFEQGQVETLGEQERKALSRCDVILVSSAVAAKTIGEQFPQKKTMLVSLFKEQKKAGLHKHANSSSEKSQTSGHGPPNQPLTIKEILVVSRQQAIRRIATTMTEKDQLAARLIAFYLPQYHPIPENDEWWGKGFTEWRNVKKTEPLFSGHYQPHVPADLGYYDLRQQEVRVAQAGLAKKYGIEGFCYYHYWFQGKRLLEQPLEDLLSSGQPDFPFCVCWANESWSRRWDGKDQDILMKQEYSESDDRQHIRALFPVFADKRYIRVNGKPLFLVYRTESMPNPARTAEVWRQEAREAGLGELYLCRVESFQKSSAADIGFDAAVEFAPDWWNKGPQLGAGSAGYEEAGSNFDKVCERNYVHTYQGLAEAMMAKEIPAYKWFHCVTPSWDNWARRNQGASVFLDSSPDKYRAWLAHCVENTIARFNGDERIVFINAWNEWAEGNHLEPDQKFGHAYLQATQQALHDGQLAHNVRLLEAADATETSRVIDKLTSQLASCEYQLKDLEVRMEDVIGSTSWRLTAPVRWLKQQVLNLKKTTSG